MQWKNNNNDRNLIDNGINNDDDNYKNIDIYDWHCCHYIYERKEREKKQQLVLSRQKEKEMKERRKTSSHSHFIHNDSINYNFIN